MIHWLNMRDTQRGTLHLHAGRRITGANRWNDDMVAVFTDERTDVLPAFASTRTVVEVSVDERDVDGWVVPTPLVPSVRVRVISEGCG